MICTNTAFHLKDSAFLDSKKRYVKLRLLMHQYTGIVQLHCKNLT